MFTPAAEDQPFAGTEFKIAPFLVDRQLPAHNVDQLIGVDPADSMFPFAARNKSAAVEKFALK